MYVSMSQLYVSCEAVDRYFFIINFTKLTSHSAIPLADGFIEEVLITVTPHALSSFSQSIERKQRALSVWTRCTEYCSSTQFLKVRFTSDDDLETSGKIRVNPLSAHFTISRWENPLTLFKFSARSTDTSCIARVGRGYTPNLLRRELLWDRKHA